MPARQLKAILTRLGGAVFGPRIYFNSCANARISRKAIISNAGFMSIGINSVVKCNSVIQTGPGGRISIGDNCSINYNCVLYGHFGLIIGNDVRIGAGTVIIPANHKFETKCIITSQGIQGSGITISDDVWIGANCSILDGVSIGRHSVVAAGSVVTRDVPSCTVVAGIPAKVIKYI